MSEASAASAAGGAAGQSPYARRNVLVLAAAQALAMTGVGLIMTVSALAGQMLADDKSLATLPLALTFAATMASTIPASLFMGRVGRRVGFTLGQLTGAGGAAIAAYAIYAGDFWLFCWASLPVGIHNAFWQYYRFAAADTAGPAYRSRAISYVMAGGVVAAVAGPQLAKWTSDLFVPYTFMGGYAAIIGLSFAAVALLQALHIPKPSASGISRAGRPVLTIARQPVFVVAVLSAMIGYGMMLLVMTATPLAMTFCGFAFTDTATVIQWHALAMFAPSFVTGHLIQRFGVLRVIVAGCLLNAAAMATNLSGIAFENFWVGLVLLGLGWNFMFVGGTTLVTEAYHPEERAKVQAFNDFLVFGTVTVASFSSGALHDALGWQAVNLGMALPTFVAFAAVAWYGLAHGRRRPAE